MQNRCHVRSGHVLPPTLHPHSNIDIAISGKRGDRYQKCLVCCCITMSQDKVREKKELLKRKVAFMDLNLDLSLSPAKHFATRPNQPTTHLGAPPQSRGWEGRPQDWRQLPEWSPTTRRPPNEGFRSSSCPWQKSIIYNITMTLDWAYLWKVWKCRP